MYLNHITTEGERWDSIAWRYYRDVSQVPRLIEANPHVAITETLGSGIQLSIPVIEEAVTSLEDLPPWKR